MFSFLLLSSLKILSFKETGSHFYVSKNYVTVSIFWGILQAC